MAYGERPLPAQRIGTLLLVLLLHAGVAAILLLYGAVAVDEGAEEARTQTFDVTLPEPPPPIVDIENPDLATPREEGAASEENIESEATPVTAPEPVIVQPTPNPITASPTPNEGRDATQGASDRPGAGTGAGGTGTGTGSGAGGDGLGGGGGTRPALVSASLTEADYPRSLRRAWPAGARVLVIFYVQVNGRATDCGVHTSSGNTAIDAETCRLVETKLRFRPATDARGRPYVERYAYMQRPVGR